MATGFVYVVRTIKTKNYIQKDFCNVPTEWGDRLYFGPCKEVMRPKMKSGDYIFGISPAEPTAEPKTNRICSRSNRRTHHLHRGIYPLSRPPWPERPYSC